MEAQLIEFLTKNNGSTKAAMSAAGLKGLALFNAIKKLQTEGKISVEGEGADATYNLVEQMVADDPLTETKDEQSENEQKNAEVAKATVKSTGRDNTKYKFNHEEYGKGPLVLAVVKKYVEDNPDATFKQLKEVFPDTLMPRWHIFRNEQEAIKLSANKQHPAEHGLHRQRPLQLLMQEEQLPACLPARLLSFTPFPEFHASGLIPCMSFPRLPR
jgi:hypothetical protein